VISNSKGVLFPRMTTAEVNAIVAPAKGLIVIDTTIGCVKRYSGLSWGCIEGSASEPWYVAGSTTGASSNTQDMFQMGKVGVGINNPLTKLHVEGTGSLFTLSSSGFGTIYSGTDVNEPWFGTSSNNSLRFTTNSLERMRISNTGNVGIGTPSPSNTLDVNGTARIRSIASGSTSDSILTADATGVVRWRNAATLGGGGSARNAVYAESSTFTSVTSAIPQDNTIPQSNEGTQILTASITPASSTTKLRITVTIPYSTGLGECFAASLFRDAGANAVFAMPSCPCSPLHMRELVFTTEVNSTATTASTFNLRVGPASGTGYVNGTDLGAMFGGTLKSTMVIEEIK
jgi:uncharacterized membrane protein